MSVFRWRGTTSTVWNLGTNWVDEYGTGYPAGRYPGSIATVYDEVHLDQAVTNAVGGYNASSDEILRVFKVYPVYDKDIGTSGTYLQISVRGESSECLIEGDACGNIYLRGVSGSSKRIAYLNLLNLQTGKKMYWRGEAETIHLHKGEIQFDANQGVLVNDTLNVAFKDSKITDVILTIGANCTLSGKTVASGGTIDCTSGITDLQISDALWTQHTGTITFMQMSSGQFTWVSGNIARGTLLGGILDGSASSTERTITDFDVHPGGSLFLNNGLRNIGYENLRYLGGTIVFDLGQAFTSIP